MRLLLDSHVLLWWLQGNSEISSAVAAEIASPQNAKFVSAASIWELRVKEATGKLRLDDDIEQRVDEQPFHQLQVTHRHAHAIKTLPLVHKDPFDRLLIAQATLEDLAVATRDEILFSRYGIQVFRV